MIIKIMSDYGFPESMWSEKSCGWRTEPCEMAAFAEQMEDEPTVGPEKELSKVQGEPENAVSPKA